MTIVEDYLDAALRRAAERPGWAGTAPLSMTAQTNGQPPAPAHWGAVGGRED
jgi:hypothetical protein